jgi:hypothetical protein
MHQEQQPFRLDSPSTADVSYVFVLDETIE